VKGWRSSVGGLFTELSSVAQTEEAAQVGITLTGQTISLAIGLSITNTMHAPLGHKEIEMEADFNKMKSGRISKNTKIPEWTSGS
jgi:hypothetical protein